MNAVTGKKQRAQRGRRLQLGEEQRTGPWPMATPSSTTTIVRMTEPLSLLPLRLTYKAKEGGIELQWVHHRAVQDPWEGERQELLR